MMPERTLAEDIAALEAYKIHILDSQIKTGEVRDPEVVISRLDGATQRSIRLAFNRARVEGVIEGIAYANKTTRSIFVDDPAGISNLIVAGEGWRRLEEYWAGRGTNLVKHPEVLGG